MVDLASETPINSPAAPLSPQITGTRTRSTTVVLGLIPQPGDLDVTGLDITAEALQAAFAVDSNEWADELPRIHEWFNVLGDTLPDGMKAELAELNRRLREAHQHQIRTQHYEPRVAMTSTAIST